MDSRKIAQALTFSPVNETRNALHNAKIACQLRACAMRAGIVVDLNQARNQMDSLAEQLVNLAVASDQRTESARAWARNAILPLICSDLENTGQIQGQWLTEIARDAQAMKFNELPYAQDRDLNQRFTILKALTKLRSAHEQFSFLQNPDDLTERFYQIISKHINQALESVGSMSGEDRQMFNQSLLSNLTDLYVECHKTHAEYWRNQIEEQGFSKVIGVYPLGIPTEDLEQAFENASERILQYLSPNTTPAFQPMPT